MVKGISRQVVLVKGPDTQLFEQAIFILKDNTDGITDEMLMKEAKRLINTPSKQKRYAGPLWACGGALLTGIMWLLSIFL